MADDDDFVRITLRIPKPLHEKLNDAAAKKRSMNAEIIARLERTFADESAGGTSINLRVMDPRFVDALLEAQAGGTPVEIRFTVAPEGLAKKE